MKQFIYISLLSFMFLSCTNQNKSLLSEELQAIKEARTLIDKHKNHEAISLLKGIVNKSVEAEYLTACAYRNLKEYHSAEKMFKEVYFTQPNYRHTCLFLAECTLKRINLQERPTKENLIIQNNATKLITEGIEYNKNSSDKGMLARYYATRGQLVQLQGNFNNAIEDLTTAIKLDPQGDYYSRRAMSYHFNGQDDFACKDFEKGRELGEKYDEEQLKRICY